MTEPTDRDRQLAIELIREILGDSWANDIAQGSMSILKPIYEQHLAAARAEGEAKGRREASEECAKLIAACERWEASLEGDGWSREDIRDHARPGMYDIFTALDAIRALAEQEPK
jgi:hypothetical protein